MKSNKRIVYALTLFIIICIVVFANILPSDNLYLYKDPIHELSDNWEVTLPDGTICQTSIPAKFDVNVDETYTISRVIEEDFPEHMNLRVGASMQYMKVYIDDELIFENKKLHYEFLHAPEASVWYLIPLPYDIQGKTLKILIHSPVKVFSGLINTVYYGENGALKFELIAKQPLGIIFAAIILIIGIIIFGASLILQNYSDNRFYYLGLFSICISIWLISEMDLFQFFTGNRFIIGGISYMLLTVIPIFFLLYLTEVVLNRYKKQLVILCGVYFILFVINLFLQVAGLVFFIDSIVYVNILILLTVITVITMLIYDIKKYNSKQAKKYSIYLSIFVITIILEILMFFTHNFKNVSSFSRIGFITFFALLIIDAARYLNEIMIKEKETQILKKLAYKDILTNGYNRAAFERDIGNLLNNEKKNSFRLILTDLNKLKPINDNYGHLEGDKALICYHNCLVSVLEGKGKCYRIGGDEFACVLTDIGVKTYKDVINKLEQCVREENSKNLYNIEMAMGSGIYTFDESFSEFMHKVDIQMYENKIYHKKQREV
jgi:diguanylate cyclase (GGDEF)-like protein